MLVERNQQSRLILPRHAFPQQLRAEHGFADSRDADDHGGGTVENAAADQIVERVHPDNGTLGRGCRLRNVAAQRSLHPAEHFQTGAGF